MKQLASRYRYAAILLRQMVVTDFKLRYQGSVLGYLWSLVRPLVLFTILYTVFVRFLKIGAGIPHAAISLLLGIVLWTFFLEVTSQSIVAIVEKGEMMRKVNFPRYVIVFAPTFAAGINLFFNMLVIGIFMVFTHTPLMLSAVLLPIFLLELFIISLAAGFFLSALYVRYRDFTYVWDLALQAIFYATPIIYPLSFVPRRYARIIALSPLAQIIQDARKVLVTNQTTTIGNLYQLKIMHLVPIAIIAVITIWASIYFRKRSDYFAEEV